MEELLQSVERKSAQAPHDSTAGIAERMTGGGVHLPAVDACIRWKRRARITAGPALPVVHASLPARDPR
jgi:hypothetical protein